MTAIATSDGMMATSHSGGYRLYHCVRDATAWDAAVRATPNTDISFLSGYTALFHWYGDGDGWLLQSGRGNDAILYPFLLRPIPGTSRFDLASPYGYTGPLGDARLRDEFRRDLTAFCRDQGVVSQFVRLHPLLDNVPFFAGDASPARRRTTVFIDLRDGETATWDAMRDPCRRKVRQARRLDIEVELTSDTDLFAAMYARAMQRLGAGAWYHFPPAFFTEAQRLLGNQMHIFLARWQGTPVGAVMGLHHGRFAHYFLAAAERDIAPPGVMNLLVWEMTRFYRDLGCETLHLGSGVAEGDPLFQFKAKFGPGRACYDQATVIEDPDAYASLSAGRSDTGFFPAYRAPFVRLDTGWSIEISPDPGATAQPAAALA
jgi:serine/alanine adding enzyme